MSQPLQVLLVEDNLRDAELLLRELQRAGYEPVCQRVDNEADFLRHLRPGLDIVLSDYALPKFDGLRALALLRQSGLDIPFILISGAIGEETAVEAIKQGATDYLLKDRPARLGAAIAHALRQKQMRAARKSAETALHQSEERFRQLAENVREVFWLTDPAKHEVLYVSPAYEEIWHRACATLYAAPDSWMDAVHPDDLARVRQAAATKLAAGTYDEEYRIVRPDGAVRWVRDRAFPVRNAEGKVYRIAGVAEDITERRAAEVELRESQHQLRALALRIDTVREDEAKRIARELHDELGQQLTALNMDLDAMEHQLPALTAPARAQFQRMHGLVDRTIEVVKKISGGLRLGVLDLLGLAAALDWQLREFAQRSGLRCTATRVDEVSGLTEAQATALFRITQEALTNIARHAAATHVEFSLRVDREALRLELGDDGRGITPAQAADRKAIGLLGMRERAQAVGAAVTIRARAGGGTTVVVTLPLASTRGKP